PPRSTLFPYTTLFRSKMLQTPSSELFRQNFEPLWSESFGIPVVASCLREDLAQEVFISSRLRWITSSAKKLGGSAEKPAEVCFVHLPFKKKLSLRRWGPQ